MLGFLPQGHVARTRSVGVVGAVFINVGVLLALFFLGEGFLSAVLLSSDVLRDELTHERVHTRYDPLLGWVAIPNLDLPNMYGPGVFLRTNSQGFRGSRDYTETVPPGKRRLICSGDSVTFGYGVEDNHAWCTRLETIDPSLETINMGQPGYGVDQAYLWYKRDAARFEHQVHLFAPITADFRRMQSTKYGGYGRPLLDVEDGQLVVTNVPVPAATFRLPWWTEIQQHFRSLRSVQAVGRLKRALADDREDSGVAITVNRDKQASKQAADRHAAEVVSRLLVDLKAVNEARGSIPVVVYLPTLNDRGPDTAFWVGVLERECDSLGIPLVNLAKEFDRMPDHEAARFYLSDLGHFSREGNEYISRLIYRNLRSLPEVSRRLFPPARS